MHEDERVELEILSTTVVDAGLKVHRAGLDSAYEPETLRLPNRVFGELPCRALQAGIAASGPLNLHRLRDCFVHFVTSWSNSLWRRDQYTKLPSGRAVWWLAVAQAKRKLRIRIVDQGLTGSGT